MCTRKVLTQQRFPVLAAPASWLVGSSPGEGGGVLVTKQLSPERCSLRAREANTMWSASSWRLGGRTCSGPGSQLLVVPTVLGIPGPVDVSLRPHLLPHMPFSLGLCVSPSLSLIRTPVTGFRAALPGVISPGEPSLCYTCKAHDSQSARIQGLQVDPPSGGRHHSTYDPWRVFKGPDVWAHLLITPAPSAGGKQSRGGCRAPDCKTKRSLCVSSCLLNGWKNPT